MLGCHLKPESQEPSSTHEQAPQGQHEDARGFRHGDRGWMNWYRGYRIYYGCFNSTIPVAQARNWMISIPIAAWQGITTTLMISKGITIDTSARFTTNATRATTGAAAWGGTARSESIREKRS